MTRQQTLNEIVKIWIKAGVSTRSIDDTIRAINLYYTSKERMIQALKEYKEGDDPFGAYRRSGVEIN